MHLRARVAPSPFGAAAAARLVRLTPACFPISSGACSTVEDLVVRSSASGRSARRPRSQASLASGPPAICRLKRLRRRAFRYVVRETEV